MDSCLMGERSFANDTLLPGQGAPGSDSDAMRNVGKFRQIDTGLDAVA
jgi:hypothetical protein